MTTSILEHDHEQIAILLRNLETALSRNDADQGHEELDLFWARLAIHIRAEHLCLFPAILTAPRKLFEKSNISSYDEAEALVEKLRVDHNFFMDELAKATKTFREIRATQVRASYILEELGTIRARVAAVSLRLVSHNAFEEDGLYRWPALILNDSDLESLNLAMKRELKNLPPRFAN